ncbi:AGAP [Acanthosepion pharaonis]|uniref:AGAP n=1 Tax=Acanthosepion pharaonis TaxID=158019 RepID=A0A812EIS7_ACAPH|nr:AGAP [Sepia pharaonis]
MDSFFSKSGDNKNIGSKIETPNVKKRHRRAKSGGLKNIDPSQLDDSDGYEFIIVSLDSKQWHFEAQSVEERDEWVSAIEQQILSSLQANESSKAKNTSATDPASIQAIRNVRGNNCCTDCGATNPDWASINLGALICIECSGIHRNLGTHLSRVRSLDLDEWPVEYILVMTSIGNSIVNSVWEANTKGRLKPGANASREDREKWIRAKYECKEFLPPPTYVDIPLNQQLIDALVREDIKNIILLLGHARPEDINAPYSKDDGRTALHIAAALGNVVFVQLLLWYNANVKVLDHEGRNALWYARGSGSPECVDLLVTNGCPEHPTLPRRRGSVQPGKNDMSTTATIFFFFNCIFLISFSLFSLSSLPFSLSLSSPPLSLSLSLLSPFSHSLSLSSPPPLSLLSLSSLSPFSSLSLFSPPSLSLSLLSPFSPLSLPFTPLSLSPPFLTLSSLLSPFTHSLSLFSPPLLTLSLFSPPFSSLSLLSPFLSLSSSLPFLSLSLLSPLSLFSLSLSLPPSFSISLSLFSPPLSSLSLSLSLPFTPLSLSLSLSPPLSSPPPFSFLSLSLSPFLSISLLYLSLSSLPLLLSLLSFSPPSISLSLPLLLSLSLSLPLSSSLSPLFSSLPLSSSLSPLSSLSPFLPLLSLSLSPFTLSLTFSLYSLYFSSLSHSR